MRGLAEAGRDRLPVDCYVLDAKRSFLLPSLLSYVVVGLVGLVGRVGRVGRVVVFARFAKAAVATVEL